MKMKKLVVAVVLMSSTITMSEEMIMTTGNFGGSYIKIGQKTSQLGKNYNLDIDILESGGSMENIERVASGDAHIGLTQSDVFKSYIDENSPSNIKIMSSLSDECLFLVGKRGGKVTGKSSLGDKGIRVGIGEKTGGTSGSWAYIERLEEKYKNVEKIYEGGKYGLSQLASNEIDAMVFVTKPGYLKHSLFKIINSNSNLVWLDFDDWDLNDDIDGKPVYEFRDIVVFDGWFDTVVEVPCTKLLVIFNTDLVKGKNKQNLAGLFIENPNSFK